MYTLVQTPTFIADLDALPNDDYRQQATAKCRFLEENPAHPSLESHPIRNTPPNRTLYESYVDRKHYRIIWEYQPNNQIALWRITDHTGIDDSIYLPNFADLNLKPRTAPLTLPNDSAVPTEPVFRGMTRNHLRLFGIPDDHLDAVLNLTNPEDLWQLPLPEAAQQLLMDLYTRQDKWTNDGIFDVRWLMYRANADELEGYCEGRLKRLLLNLAPDQAALTTYHVNGPLLIKGTAGSGKTTIGLYRAHHLVQQRFLDAPPRVLLLTYTRTLAHALEELYIDLYGTKDANLTVGSVYDYFFETLFPGETLTNTTRIPQSRARQNYISGKQAEIKRRLNATKLPDYLETRFLLAEIDYIKGRVLTTADEYLAVERTGRGRGLTATQRRDVWAVYEHYQKQLATKKQFDYLDLPRLMLDHVQATRFPRFDTVIVDEVQDLPPATLRTIRALVKDQQNGTGLTLLADPAQSIYYRGIPWREANLQVAGSRTQILKKNYRNTRQVLQSARTLIESSASLLASNEYIDPDTSERHGPKPIVLYAATPDEEAAAVAQEIIRLCQQQRYRPGDVAILARTERTLTRIDGILKSYDLFTRHFRDIEFRVLENEIKLITMHSAKGLEFPVVFVCSLNEGEIPNTWAGVDDDTVEQERKLLYVSMTRAAERLYLTAVRTSRSSFFHHIDPATLEVRKVT